MFARKGNVETAGNVGISQLGEQLNLRVFMIDLLEESNYCIINFQRIKGSL